MLIFFCRDSFLKFSKKVFREKNEKQENQEEYKDIESDFSQKCLSIHRNILPGVPQDASINNVIDNISKTR